MFFRTLCSKRHIKDLPPSVTFKQETAPQKGVIPLVDCLIHFDTSILHVGTQHCCLGLETAKCCHVFGLLTGNAPVIGLVDGLVMFPGGFVVDGKSLDRLCGECLKLDGKKSKKRV